MGITCDDDYKLYDPPELFEALKLLKVVVGKKLKKKVKKVKIREKVLGENL